MRWIALLTVVACGAPPPSPKDPCTATGTVDEVVSTVADGGVTATGTRYIIPFANNAPNAQLFVSTSGDDANAGTSATAARKTIQAAFDAAMPGTAIAIAAGTYTENIKLGHSGLEGSPIWLVGAAGGATKIVPADQSQSTFQGYAVHDLVLQGLDVTSPAPTTGDNDGIKFAANGDVSVAENQNARLAVVDCAVHTATTAGYNGIKISTADHVYIIHDAFDGAGTEATGDAMDFVGNTNSEIAYNFATNVPTHAAFQIKGGSTTVVFHHNVITGVGGDGLWIGGGTIEEFMHPSSAYEACNVTASNNVMHDLGQSAVHFIGGQGSLVEKLFTWAAANHYVQVEESTVHTPAIASKADTLITSVFDPAQDVLSSGDVLGGAISINADTDVALVLATNTAGHNAFTGGALIRSGGGNDTYTLTASHGSTEVVGFQVGSDVVKLSGFGLASFAQVMNRTHQLGPHVLVDLPDGFVLVLDGVSRADLTSANFSF